MRRQAKIHKHITYMNKLRKYTRRFRIDRDKSKHTFQKFELVSKNKHTWLFKKHNAWLISNELHFDKGEGR